MIGQDLLSRVNQLRDAVKKSEKGVLNRIFDLHDAHFEIKTKRNCVNCATECLARLTVLAKQYLTQEIPSKMAIKQKTIAASTLEKYRIPKPFRPFGSQKTYAEFNTTDKEVEALLKAEPQHLLRFTMADGSPVVLGKVEAVVAEVDSSVTEQPEIVEEKPKRSRGRKANVETDGD